MHATIITPSLRTFHHPERKACAVPVKSQYVSSGPWQPLIYAASQIFLIRVCHVNRIAQCLVFGACLLSLACSSGFIHDVAHVSSLFLLMAEYYSTTWTHHVCLSLYPSTGTWMASTLWQL